MKKSSWLVLFMSACVSMAHAAPSGESDKDHPKAQVQVLCLGVTHASKYKAGTDGLVSTAFEDDSLNPPHAVYVRDVKDEKAYNAVSLIKNGLSPDFWIKSDAKAKFYGDVYLRASSPPAESSKKAVESWVPFLRLPIVSKKQLVCLYQPVASSAWAPPKMVVLDTAAEKFPTGTVLALNASTKAVVVQIGEGKSPIGLRPGETALVPFVPDASGACAIRIAIKSGEKMKVLCNTAKVIKKDTRQILAVYSTDPGYAAGRTEDFSFFKMTDI